MKTKIPWAKPYISKEELNEVKKVFSSNWFSMGPKVENFEKVLRRFIGTKYSIAVNSGAAALDIALKILGIKRGDEVIIPALSYIATANAVLYQNATPVFADIDSRTFNIEPKEVEKNITGKTRCVIAIDYAGQAPDYERLRAICRRNNIFLVEDGAPGLGGRYNDRMLCSMGDISITSFHIAKVLTSIEGGMIFTDNKQYRNIARMLRSQGEEFNKKYHHPYIGHNYRMSDLHAAIGLVQAGRLKRVLEDRARISSYYNNRLKHISGITLSYVTPQNKHAWFLYPILVNKRNKVKEYLEKNGIETNISWPIPVYKQKPYLRYKKKICPVVEEVTKRILCLPIYYGMTKKELNRVVNALIKSVKTKD